MQERNPMVHIKKDIIDLDAPTTSGIKRKASPIREAVAGPSTAPDVMLEPKRLKQQTQDQHGPPGVDGKVKSEYYSDNSASLPGLMGTPGPVGFEPGMFKKESEDHKQKGDSSNKVIIFNNLNFIK